MGKIVSAKAMIKTFPEGAKYTAILLTYDGAAELKEKNRYQVVDRSYEPTVPGEERRIISLVKVSENEIVIELDINEHGAFAVANFKNDGTLTPYGPEPVGLPDPGKPKTGPGGPGGPGGKKPMGPPPDMGYCGPKPLKIDVTADGESIRVTEGVNPEAEAFEIRAYEGLSYNLYIPKDYDSGKKYPLVLFITDAGTRGVDVRTPLYQGIGGTVFAGARDQKKHPCFVVAPNFTPNVLLTRDDFSYDESMYKAKYILDELQKEFSIDEKKIYTTGQSMGCMSSCQLMMQWPEYFAGAILVAGQWDPVGCGKALLSKKVWILVSENDMKAHPGMDAVTEAVEANGGKVVRSSWSARLPVDEQNAKAQEALKEKADVYYTLFEGSTVVPEGSADAGPGANHVQTWRVAYQIDRVRDFLFEDQ